MTKLSVNINKFATLRNARGGNLPDLLKTAKDCEKFGAEGITVHPRPDERHIRYQDVVDLKKIVSTEFNIEGNPIPKFIELVLQTQPTQVTLVPDAETALTSDSGWDTLKHRDFLKDVVAEFKKKGIRTSLFVNAERRYVEGAAQTGTDRIELYTGPYAHQFAMNPEEAVKAFAESARVATELGLGLNAGHDLNLDNLKYLKQHLAGLLEVSIGHALICDAIYYGLENTIQMYRRQLE